MCQLLETILIRNHQPCNLIWHQQRVERSFEILWGTRPVFSLEQVINIPADLPGSDHKYRILYDRNGITHQEIEIYHPRQVNSLKVIHDDQIDYRCKYADRSAIQSLYRQRGSADDILIVKNGLITDTCYANVLLDDGKRWFTPAFPLLPGTRRAQLLEAKLVIEVEIKVSDLQLFQRLHLINAMLEPGQVTISIDRVSF